jgi:8-oxo-dGTP pyrophosphatase MutT (NUDIX family)
VLVYLYRRTHDGQVEWLLLRRTAGRGGFWQGVTGAPEWGESDDEAAAREVLEETGFVVGDGLRRVGFRYELRRREEESDDWERLYGPGVEVVPEEAYAAEVGPGRDPVVQDDEHDTFAWCPLDEALDLLFWEDNRRALVAAHDLVPSVSRGGAGRGRS